jgi:hypothetical protein
MRTAFAVAALAALALARSAAAGPAQCQQLDRQILHYQGMAERADRLGSEMWEDRTQDQVDRLMERRVAAGCPVPVKDSKMGEAFMQILKLAGKAALAYFTFGAL